MQQFPLSGHRKSKEKKPAVANYWLLVQQTGVFAFLFPQDSRSHRQTDKVCSDIVHHFSPGVSNHLDTKQGASNHLDTKQGVSNHLGTKQGISNHLDNKQGISNHLNTVC